MKRHQLYYEGPLSKTPNVRPWSLHRNGHLGVARYGGWIWSGDTHASFKTLEAQIAVGINHSLSLSPFWGSDIGGFYPTPDLTGELYARWFQFAAFTPSFRGHGASAPPRVPGDALEGSLEGHATDVLDLLEGLGEAPPVLVGHSFGGLIAQLVATWGDDRPQARGAAGSSLEKR